MIWGYLFRACLYTHFPNPQQAEKVSGWLHAAVDSKMMKFLKTELKKDPLEDFNDWPKTIKEVDSEEKYQKVQTKVKQYIEREKKSGKHRYENPVHFDDIFWREIKYGRKGAYSVTKQSPHALNTSQPPKTLLQSFLMEFQLILPYPLSGCILFYG